jgi:transketolase
LKNFLEIHKENRISKLIFKAFSPQAFQDVLNQEVYDFESFKLLSFMLKNNILLSIQFAGSGHLGTSFSVSDIMLALMICKFKNHNKFDFFSSKGHDAPCLYACFEAFGLIPPKSIMKLRRLNGLPGHPDIETEGVIFNTGSLGMGISKSNGRIFANNILGMEERVFCILGDGEFQEGQNFESLMFLQNHQKINPIIIMDSNAIQSDKWIKNVKSYDSLEAKVRSFGIEFIEIDGHSIEDLSRAFKYSLASDKSIFINAKTLKGSGVDFISSTAFGSDLDFYPYHSGALNEADFSMAYDQINESISKHNKKKISLETFDFDFSNSVNKINNINKFDLLMEYSIFLKEIVKKDKSLYILGADLVKDSGCKNVYLEQRDRYIEFGIAEQDMVSFASGLASRKFEPWVHSFACFLTTRAQEQIFNFCSEKRKGVFVGSLAGPIPGGPGHSHQMIRDISIMSSMPYLVIFEPLNKKMLTNFYNFYKNNSFIYYLRITNIPFDNSDFIDADLPEIGNLLHITDNMSQKVVICQGPSIIEQALSMYKDLKAELKCAVDILSPVWLNKISDYELNFLRNKEIYLFESANDHGGFSSLLSKSLLENSVLVKKFVSINIKDMPICGTNLDVLNFHGFSANKIKEVVFEEN